MPEALRAHLRTHLRFFMRNRLALATGGVFLLFAAITIVGSSIYTTTGGHLTLIQQIGDTMLGFVRFLVPAMGLLLVFTHVKGRSLRVVLTKPQAPELWLFSGLLAVAALALALSTAVLLLQTALALYWRMPSVLPGLVYVAADSFVRSLVSVGYLFLLATLFHPVVALLLLSLFNEETLNGLREMLALQRASSHGGFLAWIGDRVVNGLFYLVPMLDPLGEKTSEAVHAFRLTGETWLLLAARAGYALVATAAFFALAAVVFRRKSWN